MKETKGCIKCIEEVMKTINEEEQLKEQEEKEQEEKEEKEEQDKQEKQENQVYNDGEAATPQVIEEGEQDAIEIITPSRHPRCKRKLEFN